MNRELEQEPCEDEYVKVPKKALKYRTAGMVAYNAEWLKNNFDIERAVICGAQEPCKDAISREDALMCLTGEIKETDTIETIIARFVRRIRKLPPVTPQPKTGHWIKDDITERSKSAYKHKCDRCGAYHRAMYDYCPSCGAKMIEPQERSEVTG